MFIGHYAPALIAATRPKAAGLGTLFLAAQIVDVGFAVLLFPGVEAMRVIPGMTAMNPMDLYYMPYTHSLLGALLWAAGFAWLLWLVTRNRAAAFGAGLVVVSHWLLDLLVHIPDLTLFGAPPKFGLGLWNYPGIAMPLEIALIGGALVYYARHTRAPGGNGRMWVLAGLLLLFQAIDWFGPKETSFSLAVPATMLAAYGILTVSGWWAGQHRQPALKTAPSN